MNVYLAGPITGSTVDECNSWRKIALEDLNSDHRINAYSPMRNKDYLPEGPLDAHTVVEDEVGKVLSSGSGILARDWWDVKRCDVLFVYLHGTKRVSIGTVMEIAFAKAAGKVIVGVIDDRHDHPFITECVTHRCPDLSTALEIVKRIA